MDMILKYAAVAAASYLLGSINTAIIYTCTVHRRDVRESGSKNAGATNAARVFGVKAGVITLAGDFVKTALALLLGSLLLGQTGVLVAAMACMIGHCFPVYYRFRGGKGVAVGAAIALLLSPRAFGVMLATFLLAFLFTHRISVCSMAGAIMFPVSLLVFGERDVLTLVCAGFVTAMVWLMHRENLKRLAAGTEPEFTFGQAQGTDKEDRK